MNIDFYQWEQVNPPEGHDVVNIAPIVFTSVGVLSALLTYVVVVYRMDQGTGVFTKFADSDALLLGVLGYDATTQTVTIAPGNITLSPDA